MSYELKCPKCNNETVSGSDETSVKETLARHMAKAHPVAKVVKK